MNWHAVVAISTTIERQQQTKQYESSGIFLTTAAMKGFKTTMSKLPKIPHSCLSNSC